MAAVDRVPAARGNEGHCRALPAFEVDLTVMNAAAGDLCRSEEGWGLEGMALSRAIRELHRHRYAGPERDRTRGVAVTVKRDGNEVRSFLRSGGRGDRQ